MSSVQHDPKRSALALMKVLTKVMDGDARQSVAFLAANFTVKATRIGRSDKRQRQARFLVTLGRPNYQERQIIKRKLAAELMSGDFSRMPSVSFPYPKAKDSTRAARKGGK